MSMSIATSICHATIVNECKPGINGRLLDLHGGNNVTHECTAANSRHVDCLEAIVAIDDVKVDILALLQRLVVAVERLDTTVVYKNVLALVHAALYGDKAIT
jgi:hypothetical protein